MKHPNKKIMKDLIKYTRKNALKYKHYTGVFIVRNNKILAKAFTTVNKDKDPTSHAELKAISKACRKIKKYHLKNCYLYSTQSPCAMCASAIVWARMKGVVYGWEGHKRWRLKIKPQVILKKSPSKIKIYPKFLEKECFKLTKCVK